MDEMNAISDIISNSAAAQISEEETLQLEQELEALLEEPQATLPAQPAAPNGKGEGTALPSAPTSAVNMAAVVPNNRVASQLLS